MVKNKKLRSRVALHTASSSTIPSAQVVGNAFVEQYYHILHTSPELAYRFYQNSSVMSRPNAGGVMTSMRTMQGINEMLLSLNFMDYESTTIETADAQESYEGGVTVLVVGCLMGKDKLKRKFTQSFFLAPQDKEYFVLNDIFRFVEGSEPSENHLVSVLDNKTVSSILSSDPDYPSALEQYNVADNARHPINSEELVYEKETGRTESTHDSCAVCDEALEWVAFGSCGHREVCSTCIIRLRLTCNDRCCCICKSESNIIFVTKALGDQTKMINDFSIFPPNPIEGHVEKYWFHEGTQAYFDDLNHYEMIKNMCKLSCNLCDKTNEQRNRGSKKTGGFNSIEQLKIHLFDKHRLFICSLCLEGRKIFIREQKLFNKSQLNQHVKSGDSVIDGSESERHGFKGHPMCEFCQKPFYGDNELYLHMSTEHFTCHICQRWHPGQYEYYNGYDDLEVHFRREHFLCEDEACLEKKFIVFAAESEMKRHDAVEHGGSKSCSHCNLSPQIPASFWQQPSAGQKTASTLLEESSFPPLPKAPSSSARRSRNVAVGSGKSTVVVGPSHQTTVEALNSSRASPVASHYSNSSTSISYHSRLMLDGGHISSSCSSPSFAQNKQATNDHTPSSCVSSTQSRASTANDLVLPFNFSNSSKTQSSSGKVSHSSSALILAERDNSDKTISNSQVDKVTTSRHPQLKVEDVKSANKALVEKIRAALDFDKDKFSTFKVLSVKYCQDLIDTAEYLALVNQFGLAHLVHELSILCPNAQKQKELIEIYNNATGSGSNISNVENCRFGSQNSSKKGKEKCEQ